MFFEPIEEHEVWSIERAASDDMADRKVRRSLMHSQYARRFIRMFITEGGKNAADDA